MKICIEKILLTLNTIEVLTFLEERLHAAHRDGCTASTAAAGASREEEIPRGGVVRVGSGGIGGEIVKRGGRRTRASLYLL